MDDNVNSAEDRLTRVPTHPHELGELFHFLASPYAERLPDGARLTMMCQLAKPLGELLKPSDPMTLLDVVYPAPDYPPSPEAYAGLCFGFGVAISGFDQACKDLAKLRREISSLKEQIASRDAKTAALGANGLI